MNLFVVIAVVVVVGVLLIIRSKSNQSSESFMLREGKYVPTDEVSEAWVSGDLSTMLKALGSNTNPVDRHFLLQSIVQACYRERKNPELRAKCIEVGFTHLSEFSDIVGSLKRDFDGELPRVTTFQHVATILAEDKRYDEAIEVCRKAISYGLDDGTKSGFEGRIKRIQKKAGVV